MLRLLFSFTARRFSKKLFTLLHVTLSMYMHYAHTRITHIFSLIRGGARVFVGGGGGGGTPTHFAPTWDTLCNITKWVRGIYQRTWLASELTRKKMQKARGGARLPPSTSWRCTWVWLPYRVHVPWNAHTISLEPCLGECDASTQECNTDTNECDCREGLILDETTGVCEGGCKTFDEYQDNLHLSWTVIKMSVCPAITLVKLFKALSHRAWETRWRLVGDSSLNTAETWVAN